VGKGGGEDWREEEIAANLSVTSRPESSGTHFSLAALRATPRTPVGGERLGKHGALSDGPSAAAPPVLPRSALACNASDQKFSLPGTVTLSAPYPFPSHRFNFDRRPLPRPAAPREPVDPFLPWAVRRRVRDTEIARRIEIQSVDVDAPEGGVGSGGGGGGGGGGIDITSSPDFRESALAVLVARREPLEL